MAAPEPEDVETTEEAPEGKGSKAMPLIVAVAALAVGGALGTFVVGPKLRPTPEAAAEKAKAAHEKKKGEEPPRLVKLEGVIVNPAGAMGQRFLIASIAFEMPDAETEKLVQESEVPLRDAVIGVIEKKPLAWLMAPGARDSLREELAGVATHFTGGKKVPVYIPQFLIQ